MSLTEVARRILHRAEVIEKYEQARTHGLSRIPLHHALARVLDELPDQVLSRDDIHMTRPFLDLLAGMSLTSETGLAPRKPARASAACVRIGHQVITQLTASGRPVKDRGR